MTATLPLMPNYRRAFVPGGCWFFTVNLLDQRESLLVDHIADLREAATATRQTHAFEIDAFVVLPDHLHAIWKLRPGDCDFSTRWRLIKTRFAKRLPKAERRSAVGVARHERGIWQRQIAMTVDLSFVDGWDPRWACNGWAPGNYGHTAGLHLILRGVSIS